jgi:exopolysaccharide production protein ExoY
MSWPVLRLASGGPVFAWSAVVGRQGRQFQRLTFHPRFHAADAAGFSKAFGALLQASGVSGLPQLVNVLTGEMSLVGPEPVTREALDAYSVTRRYYLLVRPGVTSLYRVRKARGRPASPGASDREYIMSWSLENDLSILRSALFLAIFRPHAASQRSRAALLSQSRTRD